MEIYSAIHRNFLQSGDLFIYQNELVMFLDASGHGEILSFKYILKHGEPYPWHTLTLTISGKNDLKKIGLNINNIDIQKRFNFIENEDSISGYIVELVK